MTATAPAAALLDSRTTARRFVLVRHVDVTGVSGTGYVAEGVEFSDGWVALHWPTETPSTILYRCINDVQKVHGHDGRTVVRWLDPFGRLDGDPADGY